MPPGPASGPPLPLVPPIPLARRSRRDPAYGSSPGGGGEPESTQGDDDHQLQKGVGVALRRIEIEPPGEQDERAGEPRLDGPADRPGPTWVVRPGQAAWAGYRQHESRRDQQAADETAPQHQRGGADGQQRQGSGEPTTAPRYGGRRRAPGGLSGGQHREEDHHRQQDAAEQQARPVRRVRGEAEYHLAGGAGGKNPALLPSVYHQRLQRPPADGRLPAGVGVLPHGEYAVDGVIGHPYPSFGGCPGAHLDGAGDRSRGRRGRPGHQGDPSRRGELARCGHQAVLPAAQVKLSGRVPPARCHRHLAQFEQVAECAAERGGHSGRADLQRRTRPAGQRQGCVEARFDDGRSGQHAHLADRDGQLLLQPQPVRVGARGGRLVEELNGDFVGPHRRIQAKETVVAEQAAAESVVADHSHAAEAGGGCLVVHEKPEPGDGLRLEPLEAKDRRLVAGRR